MTIFEMLEKLETEVVSLRTRYQDLASSLEHLQANGASPGPAAPKRRATRKKNKATKTAAKGAKRKAGTPRKTDEARQLELPVSEAAVPAGEEQPARTLGKRQALGKSLVQLRKMSAWRTSHSPHSETDSA